MFNELPVLHCENEATMAMNYLILAFTAYKAAAEVIFDRLVNVTIVCQIIKPLLNLKKYNKFLWSHQAIFTLIRTASNIFLMELLGVFYDLKSQLLENEEHIIKDIEGRIIEEKTSNAINWFIHNEIPDKSKKQLLLILKLKRQLKERNRKKKQAKEVTMAKKSKKQSRLGYTRGR